MKSKITLTLLLVLLGNFLLAQVNIVALALDGTGSTELRMPNGTSSHTTLRGHFIIRASELNHIDAGTVFCIGYKDGGERKVKKGWFVLKM